MSDLGPPLSASIPADPRRHPRSVWLTIIVFVTGFLGVLFLGLGILVWVAPRSQVNIDIGIDQFGHHFRIFLHRFGLGAVLFGAGVWFTLLTRGLWQRKRYGRVLGWVTVALVVAVAALVAFS
jgi:uncharacterized BrkB/YihY/UPF0761 family membrane protein